MVIAHHEVAIRGDDHISDVSTQGLVVRPFFGEGVSVDENSVAPARQVITGQPNHSLHEVVNWRATTVFVGWSAEYQDVTSVDVSEIERQFAHHDAVTNQQCWLHRSARNVKSLNDEATNQER